MKNHLTLVELLVCAAILALLATLLLPLYEIDTFRDKEDDLRKIVLDVRSALSDYQKDNYTYPCIGDIILGIKQMNSYLPPADQAPEPQNLKEILENALMLPRYADRDRAAMDYDLKSGKMLPYDIPGKIGLYVDSYVTASKTFILKFDTTNRPPLPLGSKVMMRVQNSNITITDGALTIMANQPLDMWVEGVISNASGGFIISNAAIFSININTGQADGSVPDSTKDAIIAAIPAFSSGLQPSLWSFNAYEYPRVPQYIRGSGYTEHYLNPSPVLPSSPAYKDYIYKKRKGFFHNPFTAVVISDTRNKNELYNNESNSWKDWEIGVKAIFYCETDHIVYAQLDSGDIMEPIYYAIGSEIDRGIPNADTNYPCLSTATGKRWCNLPNNGTTANTTLSFYNMKFERGGKTYVMKFLIVDIRYPCIDTSAPVVNKNYGVSDFRDNPDYFSSFLQGLPDLDSHKVINITTNLDMTVEEKHLWDL